MTAYVHHIDVLCPPPHTDQMGSERRSPRRHLHRDFPSARLGARVRSVVGARLHDGVRRGYLEPVWRLAAGRRSRSTGLPLCPESRPQTSAQPVPLHHTCCHPSSTPGHCSSNRSSSARLGCADVPRREGGDVGPARRRNRDGRSWTVGVLRQHACGCRSAAGVDDAAPVVGSVHDRSRRAGVAGRRSGHCRVGTQPRRQRAAGVHRRCLRSFHSVAASDARERVLGTVSQLDAVHRSGASAECRLHCRSAGHGRPGVGIVRVSQGLCPAGHWYRSRHRPGALGATRA